jgi:hypothetical protein
MRQRDGLVGLRAGMRAGEGYVASSPPVTASAPPIPLIGGQKSFCTSMTRSASVVWSGIWSGVMVWFERIPRAANDFPQLKSK